ncbi:MAG: hypothetical protein HY047_04995 [Acidobacteria bacterium]|nr:hypothetical protein [Acidobacteriota bacterium]
MIRGANGIAALGGVLLTGSIALAQAPAGQRGGAPPPPPPMTNLQIFPKDTPRPQLIAAMQNFTSALGVPCKGQ